MFMQPRFLETEIPWYSIREKRDTIFNGQPHNFTRILWWHDENKVLNSRFGLHLEIQWTMFKIIENTVLSFQTVELIVTSPGCLWVTTIGDAASFNDNDSCIIHKGVVFMPRFNREPFEQLFQMILPCKAAYLKGPVEEVKTVTYVNALGRTWSVEKQTSGTQHKKLATKQNISSQSRSQWCLLPKISSFMDLVCMSRASQKFHACDIISEHWFRAWQYLHESNYIIERKNSNFTSSREKLWTQYRTRF